MTRTAVVAGVGPGLGASLVRRFAREGCDVGMFARSTEYLEQLAGEVEEEFPGGGRALPVKVDLTDASTISAGFREVRDELGPVRILVVHASDAAWKGILELTPEELERSWQVNGMGAFLCCREAVPDMLESGGGTIIFTGATSAIRGRDGALGFSAVKFAARGMAQSLARELGPEGIHVAHVVIDGQIDQPGSRFVDPDRSRETLLDPDAIAESYWHLVEQHRSSWTLELDVRPHLESF